MKNLIHVNTCDVKDYTNSLWVSDIFKQSNDWLNDQLEVFAKSPRFFCDMSDEVERSHFSTWWNVITHRVYDNPYIQDLYYLHEIIHANTMPYVKDMSFLAFGNKMRRNELEASVFSEMLVYFHQPDLREYTFDKEIYVDRFLTDPYLKMWKSNKTMLINLLTTMRHNVMVEHYPSRLDEVQRWINKFSKQNDSFADVWMNYYDIIENHMSDFVMMSLSDENKAIDMHMEWLYKNMESNIPFERNARVFNDMVIK